MHIGFQMFFNARQKNYFNGLISKSLFIQNTAPRYNNFTEPSVHCSQSSTLTKLLKDYIHASKPGSLYKLTSNETRLWMYPWNMQASHTFWIMISQIKAMKQAQEILVFSFWIRTCSKSSASYRVSSCSVNPFLKPPVTKTKLISVINIKLFLMFFPISSPWTYGVSRPFLFKSAISLLTKQQFRPVSGGGITSSCCPSLEVVIAH